MATVPGRWNDFSAVGAPAPAPTKIFTALLRSELCWERRFVSGGEQSR
jgi:hypothetical protein